MANLTGKGGKRFQPGVSGNPSGGKKKDPLVRQFQETTYKDFIAKLQMFGTISTAELKAIAKDPSTTVFDLVFAQILLDASAGKADARQVLLDRLWGKVKEMDVTAPYSADQELMKRIPIGELIELARKYSKDVS